MARRDQIGLFPDLPPPPKPGGRRARYFFALWPDDTVRRRLASAAAQLPIGEGPAAYRIKPDRLHLTLAWLGELSRAQVEAAKLAAKDVRGRQFLLRLDRLDHFVQAGVLWIGPSSLPPELARLKAELDRELLRYGLPVAEEPFVPHVSCQRNVRAPVVAARPSVYWPALEFVLLRSARSASGRADGYRVVKRWPLGDAA